MNNNITNSLIISKSISGPTIGSKSQYRTNSQKNIQISEKYKKVRFDKFMPLESYQDNPFMNSGSNENVSTKFVDGTVKGWKTTNPKNIVEERKTRSSTTIIISSKKDLRSPTYEPKKSRSSSKLCLNSSSEVFFENNFNNSRESHMTTSLRLPEQFCTKKLSANSNKSTADITQSPLTTTKRIRWPSIENLLYAPQLNEKWVTKTPTLQPILKYKFKLDSLRIDNEMESIALSKNICSHKLGTEDRWRLSTKIVPEVRKCLVALTNPNGFLIR